MSPKFVITGLYKLLFGGGSAFPLPFFVIYIQPKGDEKVVFAKIFRWNLRNRITCDTGNWVVFNRRKLKLAEILARTRFLCGYKQPYKCSTRADASLWSKTVFLAPDASNFNFWCEWAPRKFWSTNSSRGLSLKGYWLRDTNPRD